MKSNTENPKERGHATGLSAVISIMDFVLALGKIVTI